MLRTVVLGVGLLVPLTAICADDKKDVPKELVPFQGTWKLTKVEIGGKTFPAAETEGARFTFTGEKAAVQGPKDAEPSTGTFKVNPKATPAEIDMTTPEGGKSIGVYKFDKDGRLTICFVKEGGKRPKGFDSSETPETVLLVLEMVKK